MKLFFAEFLLKIRFYCRNLADFLSGFFFEILANFCNLPGLLVKTLFLELLHFEILAKESFSRAQLENQKQVHVPVTTNSFSKWLDARRTKKIYMKLRP